MQATEVERGNNAYVERRKERVDMETLGEGERSNVFSTLQVADADVQMFGLVA